jgi:molecular chaperone DnaK
VVGRLLADAEPLTAILLQRDDGLWQSEAAPVGADGSFALMISLLPRQSCSFAVFGLDDSGGRHALRPGNFSVTHGVTLGEPPLARSIGIALADNSVQTYFERGAPLPIRRSFTLLTAETVMAGADGYALKVPIVQGEFSSAHLCRLVGTLEIASAALERSLPVSSEIEIVIELDRGGQLRANARIANVDQVFSEVALLVTPQLAPDEIEAAVLKLQTRAEHLSRRAFLDRAPAEVNRLAQIMTRLDAIHQNITAWRGGDLDAGEQLRRGLLDLDALLAEFETDQAWPELAERLEQNYGTAMSWAAEFATPSERVLLDKAYQSGKRALAAKQADEVERQLTLIARLGQAAHFRHPRAWEQHFTYAAAQLSDCADIRRAHELIARGNELLSQNRGGELEAIVRELWELAPINHEAQILGHGSGVRRR